jgi:hypothetical protein
MSNTETSSIDLAGKSMWSQSPITVNNYSKDNR